jgi:hypothetical protein
MSNGQLPKFKRGNEDLK